MRVWLVGLAAAIAAAVAGGPAWASSTDDMVDRGYALIAADPDAALRLFETAAGSGSGKALNALGNFWNGDAPVRRDEAKARGFYRRAESAGYTAATLNLGRLDWYSDDDAKQAAGCDRMQAVIDSKTAARDKRAVARALLGQCHVYGIGRPKGLVKGLSLMEQADAEGEIDGEALRLLGHSWLAGWGGRAEDSARALAYYRRAAERDGAQIDLVDGRALIRKSAEAGYVPAQVSLGVVLATGDGGEENDEEARLWYLSAAEQGSAHAMRALGAMLIQGEGGAVDTVSGVALLELAQGAGDEAAAELIGQARETTVPERLRIERLKSRWLATHGEPATDEALMGDAGLMLEPGQTPT
jgi:uncharacterized protein